MQNLVGASSSSSSSPPATTAIVVGRVAVPPLSNTFISLVKDTSLAAAITVPELFQSAQRIVATTYEPLILYIEAALIYLAMSSVLAWLQERLEVRFARYGGMLETSR